MSTYYDFYLGYKKEDGLIYPLGPFDDKGRFFSIFYRSRSFVSDLYQDFWQVDRSNITKVLSFDFVKNIAGEHFFDGIDINDAESVAKCIESSYLYICYSKIIDLPSGSYIIKGYAPNEYIRDYEESGDPDDVKFSIISNEEYTRELLKYYRSLSLPTPYMIDENGNKTPILKENEDEDTHSILDYSPIAIEDRVSKEYESFLIRNVASMITGTNDEYENIYVVCTAG